MRIAPGRDWGHLCRWPLVFNKVSALRKTDRTGVDEPDGMSEVN
jgi:hypothetical protein